MRLLPPWLLLWFVETFFKWCQVSAIRWNILRIFSPNVFSLLTLIMLIVAERLRRWTGNYRVQGSKSPRSAWARLALCAHEQGTSLYSRSANSEGTLSFRFRVHICVLYIFLTCVHVKERHRLFKKSMGWSRYCWLYFKTTLIYSRFQSMGQGRLWSVWVSFALVHKGTVSKYLKEEEIAYWKDHFISSHSITPLWFYGTFQDSLPTLSALGKLPSLL